MVVKITYYIGANNATGDRQEEKIANTLSGDFNGFTLIPCIGYFKGKKELSTMAVIWTDYKPMQISDVGRNLCIECGQDCIVVESGNEAYILTKEGKVLPFVNGCKSVSEERAAIVGENVAEMVSILRYLEEHGYCVTHCGECPHCRATALLARIDGQEGK